MSRSVACLSAALILLITACIAHAQRLDLDAPAAPALPQGSILTHLAERLNTEAEEFRLEHRALPDDAPPVEHLAMRTRIALSELLAIWLTEDSTNPDTAATRHAALALTSQLPRFDEACRTIVRANNPAQHSTQRLALDTLACLADPECRPMLRATALDDQPDDPLIRAIAQAFNTLITNDQPPAPTTTPTPIALPDPITNIAQQHNWPADLTQAWTTTTAAWSTQAAQDPLFRAWIEQHLEAMSAVLASISADTTSRDTDTIDTARDLLAALLIDDAAHPQRTIASLLQDAALTNRTLRAIEALATNPPDRRTARPDREALREARRAAYQRWLSSALPPSHLRVVAALERVAAVRTEANRDRPRSSEPPGPIATERRLRATLVDIEAELLQSLPTLLTDRARLTHPETITLLTRHHTAATTLINYLELPARRAELTIEQGTGIDTLLIGRINQQLARWQRETASNNPAEVNRAHTAINAYSRLHAAYLALQPSALADLARAIDRPALARADWREAITNQRRAALNALAQPTGTNADLATANEIAERLETFARLTAMAGTDQSPLAIPLHRHFAPTIELALTQLRDNAFGRALEPMTTTHRAASALTHLGQLLNANPADPVPSAALATLLEQPPTDSPLSALRNAGRPWTTTGPPRIATAHAIRWLGELHHASQNNTPPDQLSRIADHAVEQLQRASEARERAQ